MCVLRLKNRIGQLPEALAHRPKTEIPGHSRIAGPLHRCTTSSGAPSGRLSRLCKSRSLVNRDRLPFRRRKFALGSSRWMPVDFTAGCGTRRIGTFSGAGTAAAGKQNGPVVTDREGRLPLKPLNSRNGHSSPCDSQRLGAKKSELPEIPPNRTCT